MDYSNKAEALKELQELSFMEWIKIGSDSGTLCNMIQLLEGVEKYDGIMEKFGYNGEDVYNWLKDKHVKGKL